MVDKFCRVRQWFLPWRRTGPPSAKSLVLSLITALWRTPGSRCNTRSSPPCSRYGLSSCVSHSAQMCDFFSSKKLRTNRLWFVLSLSKHENRITRHPKTITKKTGIKILKFRVPQNKQICSRTPCQRCIPHTPMNCFSVRILCLEAFLVVFEWYFTVRIMDTSSV